MREASGSYDGVVRLVGTIRPTQTAELEAVGHDRASAYEALAALVPAAAGGGEGREEDEREDDEAACGHDRSPSVGAVG